MSASSCLRVYYPAASQRKADALHWLATFPAYVPLLPVRWTDAPAGLRDALTCAPRAETVLGVPPEQPQELVAVHPDGGVYRGAKAWLMALWATREFRARALRIVRRGQTAEAERLVAREMYIWGVAPREYARTHLGPEGE